MGIHRRTGLTRKLGICYLCPPDSAATRLYGGRCAGHYAAYQQAEKQKKFAQKSLDNLILQFPDLQLIIRSLFCRDCGQLLDPQHDGIEIKRGEIYQCLGCYRAEMGRDIPRHLLFFYSKKYLLKLNLQTDDFQSLRDWYLYHISRCDWICENCQSPIHASSEAAKFSCQAHILPKEHFPSVALHKLNHLVLGGIFSDCSCHYSYDFSWQKAQKMAVFPLAISLFMSFKNHLSEGEKNRLPEPFVKYL